MESSHPSPVAQVDPHNGYFSNIDDIRHHEYPQLQGTTYLDHAATTPYARSLVTAISDDLTNNVFGNPHSASSSSQLSSSRIDSARVQILRFLKADPDHFDVVFVSNATAAIKLVAEAFRDLPEGFSYLYHVESHTSLVGVRQLANLGCQCLDDAAVEEWLSAPKVSSDPLKPPTLFAYPGQSNLSGYRPPWEWCRRVQQLRKDHYLKLYSLYDAAALLSTAGLDFSNAMNAPDFTAFSLYKIFGLPDLGALVIRRECSDVFNQRRYFGGGTVDMVVSLGSQWHAPKTSSLHSRLEDGTLPFHSIIAAGWALSTHHQLFGSMHNISRHTSFLARRAYDGLASLRHFTGVRACEIYGPAAPDFVRSQGPTIAFNLRDAEANWIGKSEVEKLASVRGIQFRTGGLCNPGGIAIHLDLSATELAINFAAGQKCGDDRDVLNGKLTGVVRVSFGAMSSVADADKLIDFITEFFIETYNPPPSPPLTPPKTPVITSFLVQKLSVFPIKSCGAFGIPPGTCWEYGEEGLAWDREWCLVHQATGVALNQKRYPQMARIRPSIDLQRRVLSVEHCSAVVDIGLDSGTRSMSFAEPMCASSNRSATVCGESRDVVVYTSGKIANFFTTAVGVPCTLARRCILASIQEENDAALPSEAATELMPGHFPDAVVDERPSKEALLANESPILLISQSSIHSLQRHIRSTDPTADPVASDSFRANIVIGQGLGEEEMPYAEDEWTRLQIGHSEGDTSVSEFNVIGPCHRCQMVCVDQQTAKRGHEPYSALAKTRRRNGKVWFGIHLSPMLDGKRGREEPKRVIMIGDAVRPQR